MTKIQKRSNKQHGNTKQKHQSNQSGDKMSNLGVGPDGLNPNPKPYIPGTNFPRERFLPVLTGLIVYMILVMLNDKLLHIKFPMPEGAAAGNLEFMIAYLTKLPSEAFILLFIGWILAAAVAGIVTARLFRPFWTVNTIIVGAIATVMVTLNLVLVPFHPSWLNALAPLITIPAVFLGGRLIGARNINQKQ